GGNKTGGGGLAVCAGDHDGMAVAHQLGQHLGAADDRNATVRCLDHFGVLTIHGARNHDHIGPDHVAGGVTDVHRYTEPAQASGNGAFGQVGTADLITLVEQHFGDAAHAGATDADEVDATDSAHAGNGAGRCA